MFGLLPYFERKKIYISRGRLISSQQILTKRGLTLERGHIGIYRRKLLRTSYPYFFYKNKDFRYYFESQSPHRNQQWPTEAKACHRYYEMLLASSHHILHKQIQKYDMQLCFGRMFVAS